jgi:3-hydroxymyristoyl/3-hydroxydecanoyl-(acyl carrier protein) dehydratase
MRFSCSREIRPDHPTLAGHFPGNPIVPGALLLGEITYALEQGWGRDWKVAAITVAKFSSLLRPGERFDIILESSGDDQVKFSIACGTRPIASGSLRCRKP